MGGKHDHLNQEKNEGVVIEPFSPQEGIKIREGEEWLVNCRGNGGGPKKVVDGRRSWLES